MVGVHGTSPGEKGKIIRVLGAQRAADVPVRDAVLAHARVSGGDEPGRRAALGSEVGEEEVVGVHGTSPGEKGKIIRVLGAQRAADVPVRDAVLAHARVSGGDEPGRAPGAGLPRAARAAACAPGAHGRGCHGGRGRRVLPDPHGRRAAAAAAARARHWRHRRHGAPVHRCARAS